MKDFRNKMQSIFPVIPKNSESAVEWEEALRSKWEEHGGWSLDECYGEGWLWSSHSPEGTQVSSPQEHTQSLTEPLGRTAFSVLTEACRHDWALLLYSWSGYIHRRGRGLGLAKFEKLGRLFKIIAWVPSLGKGNPRGNTFMTVKLKAKFSTWK